MSATYPRRWLVAIVFASIVALTAGSFTDVWAASNGAGGSLPTQLANVDLDVDEVTVRSQGSRTFTSTVTDIDGDPVTGVTFEYTVVTASGGSFPDDTVGAYTAPIGPKTVTVKVVATQGSLTAEDTAIVNVSSPTPTPVPTAVPVNPPGDIPSPPPPSTAGAEIEIITPEAGGTVILETTGTSGEPGREVTVNVPAGAVDDFLALEVAPVASTSVPPVPEALRIRVSGTVVDLTFKDADGNAIDGFVADRAVVITISYTTQDAEDAGGAQNLVIMKYDEVTLTWVALPTSVDLLNKTISASVKSFSLFGVGVPDVEEPASLDPTATPGSGITLPATGDVAPGNNAVIAFTIIGLLLMTGGITVIRRRSASGGLRNRS